MKKREKKDKRGLFFPMRARYAKPKINLPRPSTLVLLGDVRIQSCPKNLGRPYKVVYDHNIKKSDKKTGLRQGHLHTTA